MAVVVCADLSVVPDVSCQICSNKFFHIAAASSYHLYALSFKYILRSLTHIAGKHHCNPHLFQNRCNTALAAASLWRSQLADSRHLAVNHIKYGIIRTMAEMIVHASVSCWYCYLHVCYLKIKGQWNWSR